MARYQGKREAPKPEHHHWSKDPEQELQDGLKSAFEDTSMPVNENIFDEDGPARTVKLPEQPACEETCEEEIRAETCGEDPQAEPYEEETQTEACGEKSRTSGGFFRSRTGKITIIVVCSILALVIGGIVGVKAWINAQAPVLPDQSQQEDDRKDPSKDHDDEDTQPTDDELYPDDGYNGEMPELTGNRKEGVYTFLLVGTDKGDGNTDTIMVASYDTVNQKVAIMSIPRDTMINEKWDIKKINSVYSRTGSSIDSLAERVKKLVGFKPDYYVKVKLDMFIKLVDLVEGVEFDVPRDMNYDDDYQNLHIHLKKGLQVLDGQKAMELVRFRRYPEGDIQRVRVQQDFMKALIQECISLKHWGKVKAYIDLAMENIDTNMDTGTIVWFAANVLGINSAPTLKMEDVFTCTLPGNYTANAWSRSVKANQSYVTIHPNEVVKVVNEHFNPYEQNVTTGMLDAMSILKNGDIASSTGNLKDQEHNRIMAVRRGEAYYNDKGEIVMGKPPAKPKQDELGNWYILDENNNKIYTDEKGNPLGGNVPTVDPNQPVDPNVPPAGPEVPPTDPETPSTEPQLPPTEPVAPDTNQNGGEAGDNADTEKPDWL